MSALSHGSQGGLNNNQRAASTIIMLCVITMIAVVFIHKESMAGDIEEAVGHKAQQEVGAWDEHDIADVSEVLLQSQRGKQRRAPAKNSGGFEDEDLMMMQVDSSTKAKNSELGILDKLGNHYDPVINDTLVPQHTSLKTAVTEEYGDFDPDTVANARAVAAAALAAGDDEATALKKAQEAATKQIVSNSAKNGEFPSFSRTIKAAAFEAQKNAMNVLEQGDDLNEAKNAAHSAATKVVHDPRSLDIAVPVADGLTQLLNNVDNLWSQMKTKMGKLTAELKKMPGQNCPEDELAVNNSHHEMTIAMLQAGKHITIGRHHHEAMKRHLKVANVHKARAEMLLQKEQPTAAKVTQQLAEQSKVKSAKHHSHAKKQAKIAQGFLSLAMQHHDHATDAALRCKASHILHQFRYAENAMDTYDEKVKEVAHKKVAAAKEAKQKQLNKAAEKEAKSTGVKEKAQKKVDHEHELDAKNPDERAAKKAHRARVHRHQVYTHNAESHFNATARIKQLVVAMQTSLPKEMTSAVVTAVKTQNGKDASKAANDAATLAIKTAAKKLATDMVSLVKKGDDTSGLMKKAIIMVLKVGRPIQPKIVAEAIKKAAKKHPTKSMRTSEHKALKQLKSTVAAETAESKAELMKKAVATATTQAAKEAQQRVAAAGGSLTDQLKAAQVAASKASTMAAAAFKAKQVANDKHAALGLLQETVTGALKKYLALKKKKGGKSSVVQMQRHVKSAIQPLLNKGITSATTAAAKEAGKKALAKGLKGQEASKFVSAAAAKAAQEAKAQGVALAGKAVANAITAFAA